MAGSSWGAQSGSRAPTIRICSRSFGLYLTLAHAIASPPSRARVRRRNPNDIGMRRLRLQLTMLNHNWKIPVKLPTGFLRLISEEEYRAALANLPNAQPVITGAAVRPPTCAAELLLSLPEGFDRRAGEMYDVMLAARAAS